MLNTLLGGCVAPGRFSSTGFGSNMIIRQSGWMLTILVIASLAIGGANSQASQDYQLGYTRGLEAYKYGLPLVTIQRTFEVQTSSVPVNKFNPFTHFLTPNFTTVVAPNFDTLYSVAWLDLSKEPQLIYVPNRNKFHGRFFAISLYDPYTENFVNLGSVNLTPQGYYAVVGPNDADIKLPKHVTRIKSKYNLVWIIERIYANNDNPKDIDFVVNRLQPSITLTPLSEFNGCGKGKGEGKPGPANPISTANNPVMLTGMGYYDQLCQLLKKFPPPDADQAQLSLLAQIGVGPGLEPSTNGTLNMHSDIVAGMIDAVANGSVEILTYIQAQYAQGFEKHNGYLIPTEGTYGTNYDLRAAVTQIAFGGLTQDQAIYPVGLLDRTGQPLTGTKNYTVHIAAGSSPPITPPPAGFWSLTVYNAQGFLVSNPINRYVINDRSTLERNSDGSVDLYLQSTPPSDQQNWLPTPAGPFKLLWRLFATQTNAIPGIMDGISGSWQPPAVMPVS